MKPTTDYIKILLDIINKTKRAEDLCDPRMWEYIRSVASNAQNQYFKPQDKWKPGLNESINMKKSELKPLIKTVLKELFNKKSHTSTGTHENYPIELEGLIIPGLSTDTDMIEATINIDYEGHPGESASGMGGPPEYSSPAVGADLNIIDWDFVSVDIHHEKGKPTKIDFKKLSPEQFESIKQAVNNYIKINGEKIESQIMDSIGKIEPDYGDSDR